LAARKLNAEISFIDFTKFFTVRNALIWDTENLDSNYQGAQKSDEKELAPNNRLFEWAQAVLSSSPWIIYVLCQVLRAIPQKRFLVAGQKCHTTGVVLRKPH
jgi:hypothetical protein